MTRPKCDIAGCEKRAVAKILQDTSDGFHRCADCLHFDGQENGWW